MFNDRLLEAFTARFYGYGSYTGGYWFVGMEEGGGNSADEIRRRLEVWSHNGRNELADLVEFHQAIGINQFFGDRPRLQTTWAKLIRMQLAAEGQEVSTSMIRRFQAQRWGRSLGDNCLIELLPLPSPSTRDWLYAQHSRLGFLQSRDIYVQQLLPIRIAHIRERILRRHPRVVCFYGLSYADHWQATAGLKLQPDSDCGAHFGLSQDTLFVMLAHPAAMGITNQYYETIGRQVRRRLAE